MSFFNMDPMAIVGLQASGALSGAIGGYYSSQVQKINLKTQAYLSEVNARIAEMGAQSALMQGQQQIGQLTLRAGQLKGAQRANLAANGVDLGVGSAAEVQASTDILKEVDANTLNANAVRNAMGLRFQEVGFENDALMKRANADAIDPAASAFSSLLNSAGSVAKSWYLLGQGKKGGE